MKTPIRCRCLLKNLGVSHLVRCLVPVFEHQAGRVLAKREVSLNAVTRGMIKSAPSNFVIDRSPHHRLQTEDFLQLEAIFNLWPKVIFYVKDRSRRWVTCKHAAPTLLRCVNLSDITDARQEDFFPQAVALAIEENDLRILKHRECIVDRVELVSSEYGELVWAKTSKLPIQNPGGDILGLVGMAQLLEVLTELPQRFEKFRTVIRMIESALESIPVIPDLAMAANILESYFRRSFKPCFGVAPQEFILQQRLRHAAKLLTQTDLSIAKIALDCGFGDQSPFSRQFGCFFGERPRSYRLQWR